MFSKCPLQRFIAFLGSSFWLNGAQLSCSASLFSEVNSEINDDSKCLIKVLLLWLLVSSKANEDDYHWFAGSLQKYNFSQLTFFSSATLQEVPHDKSSKYVSHWDSRAHGFFQSNSHKWLKKKRKKERKRKEKRKEGSDDNQICWQQI